MPFWSRWFSDPVREREQRRAAERVERIRLQAERQVQATREQLERLEREKGWSGGLPRPG